MKHLRCTLLSDGSSDRQLIPALKWAVHSHCPSDCTTSFEWADLARLPNPPKKLADKVKTSIDLYPCDILFVHRDAETANVNKRRSEIIKAIGQISTQPPTYICVIPVHMQEAWLLIDEEAIRKASGNPNGKVRLNMPPIHKIESMRDPKSSLLELIEIASEKTGRKLAKLRTRQLAYDVAREIADKSKLRQLNAFCTVENEIETVLGNICATSSGVSRPR